MNPLNSEKNNFLSFSCFHLSVFSVHVYKTVITTTKLLLLIIIYPYCMQVINLEKQSNFKGPVA